MAEGPRRRALRCDACGAEIAVRTFKAGAVACPACGAVRDLGEDLAGRMRAVQAEAALAAATSEPESPVAPATAPGTSRLWFFALILLGLAAAAWSFLS